MLEPLQSDDVVRAAELIAIYSDAPLGFVDASIAATAERLGVISVLSRSTALIADSSFLHERFSAAALGAEQMTLPMRPTITCNVMAAPPP